MNKTRENSFLDNLRDRHPNVRFDCTLRGYIGELAMKKWLVENGINPDKTDYLADGDNIDVDFLVKGKNVELKTSLIPDVDETLERVLSKRDIKLIRRGCDSVEQLRGNIHVQIYFNLKTKERDCWLKSKQVNINNADDEFLYDAFGASVYKDNIYFVAWIDKNTLIKRIYSLPIEKRYWSFRNSQRQFWLCKLLYSHKPIDLLAYLQKL